MNDDKYINVHEFIIKIQLNQAMNVSSTFTHKYLSKNLEVTLDI